MCHIRSALVAVLAGHAAGQFSGWEPNQVNASLCMWKEPRAAVIRDTVYLDGGFMYWTRGLSDGSVSAVYEDDNPRGLMFSLNFSVAFNLTQNLTALFQSKSKAAGGSGNANGIAPNYLDGGMLANDAELFLYGGLVKQTDASVEPRADDIMGYQAYQYGPERPTFEPGFTINRLPEGMTRYVAYGASVNAPSENKAWYFSGLRSPSWGPIYRVSPIVSVNAINASDTLVTLDMQTQLREVWSNVTLPPDVKGRANAEVVWVPVGSQGILVVIGGVVFPDFVTPRRVSLNPAASKVESDEFMKVIDIYDVASGKWYKQSTEGGPSALTRGCAVLGTAKDFSSFNIYYYGGYPGVDPKVDFSDDVWVLSLPSFTWTKVSQGSAPHGRAGHKCFKPYGDQMMVIGGYTPSPGVGLACLKDNGIIQMFNLTSARWMSGYDPQKYSEYGVPDAVIQKIGGGAVGAATAKEPVPSGWGSPELGSIFATAYATTKLKSWYPYPAATPTTRPTVPDDNNGGGGNGLPSWVAPVLGVVLGLVFVTALMVAFCLWRRRKLIKRGGMSDTSTEDNGMRILSWIRGQPSEAKAPTVITDETPVSPNLAEARAAVQMQQHVPTFHHELPGTPIAELPDTSPRNELQDTGLTPIEIINKHSHFGGRPSANPSSYYGSVSGNEQASSISRSSGALGVQSRGSISDTQGFDSQSVASDGPQTESSKMLSGVSGLSERDARHLRQISEATVSSASSGGDQAQPQPTTALGGRGPAELALEAQTQSGGPTPISPGGVVSPPTAGSREGEDYLSAKEVPVSPAAMSPAATSPFRKSVFHESEEDLGGRR